MTLENSLIETLSEREFDILRLIAEGLSNREIGERLYLSPETIKWYNRQIFGKLGVDSRTKAVAAADRQRLLDKPRVTSQSQTASAATQLPTQITSFIGRQIQLAEIRRLLHTARLLTLSGPGGTGKTRLALQVATSMVDQFPDGVAFVDLASTREPELVPQAILGVFRVSEVPDQAPKSTLTNHLRAKRMLLLIDNFEHMIAASTFLLDLLEASPGLSLLVTSRESLRVSGEQIYEVPPLSLPDLDRLDRVSEVERSEALSLLVQRAQSVRSDFALTPENVSTLARICHRLDGLPLAIELAAARIRLYSPDVVLSQIEDHLGALKSDFRDTPARQRTLQATISWSYDLLSQHERTLFVRLAVFQGGRTIEAVEQVCGQRLSIDILEALESLVNKSLLQTVEDPSGEPRFVFLETVHAFAFERLEASGEAEEMRRRHASFFAGLVERARPEVRAGSKQIAWLQVLESEHANLRAALTWAFGGGDREIGLRLVAGLGHFWYRQGNWEEGEHWTARALDDLASAPEALQAAVYHAAGAVSHTGPNRERGREMYRRAVELFRRLGARQELGWSLILLAAVSIGVVPEYEDAMSACEEGMRLLWDVDDMPGIAQGYNVIGELSHSAGDSRRARTAYTEALEIARKQDDKLREAMNLCNLAYVTLEDGDALKARELIQESLKVEISLANLPETICAIASMSGPLAALGEFERAARLIGASDELLERNAFRPQPGDKFVLDAYRAAVMNGMGADDFEAAYRAGRALSYDEAFATAMQDVRT